MTHTAWAFATMRTKARFARAIHTLKKLPPARQRKEISVANDKFIRDLCSVTCKLRNHTSLPLTKKMKQDLKKYAPKLRALTKKRTSVAMKRKVLSTQRGGIAPFLIPIIVAAIGAGGSVASAATAAAISRA